MVMNNFDYTIVEMIENASRNIKLQPLYLGGGPGGIVGQLSQDNVMYDVAEAEMSGFITESGSSLVDNMNHIRYRIKQLEESTGTNTFLLLIDTPDSYTGMAGKAVVVNATEDGLEFTTISGSVPSGSYAQNFTDLLDVPASYTGQGEKLVSVKTDETGLEFIPYPVIPPPFGGHFTDLVDVSVTYAGNIGLPIVVNAGEDGLELGNEIINGHNIKDSNGLDVPRAEWLQFDGDSTVYTISGITHVRYTASGVSGGDMYKSTYDTDNDGIVDNAEALEGQAGSYYLDRTNHTGTQLSSTISDLADQNTRLSVAISGSLVGTRRKLNVIPGANIVITGVDDNAGEKVDLTIAASGLGTGDMQKAVYDVNNDGLVDDSDKLDGQHGSHYLDRTNHTGTQASSTISDLADQNTRVAVAKSGTLTGTRRKLNFIPGTNISIVTADDSANEKVDITITASGTGLGDMLKATYDTNNDGLVDDSDKLDGQHGSYYLSRSNHTGTQTASTISDLADQNTRVNVRKAGTSVGTRRGINFIEGSNVSITAADDSGNERVNITIAASGGGSFPTLASTKLALTDGTGQLTTVSGIYYLNDDAGTAEILSNIPSENNPSIPISGVIIYQAVGNNLTPGALFASYSTSTSFLSGTPFLQGWRAGAYTSLNNYGAVSTGMGLLRLGARGWDGDRWSATQGTLAFVADGNWSGTSHPTKIELYTSDTNTTSQSLAATIKKGGGIDIPSGKTYDINGSPHTHAKASGSDVTTGTDDNKFVTPKALADAGFKAAAPKYLPFGVYAGSGPFTANATPYAATIDRTLTLVKLTISFYVSTTNNASNYWDITLDKAGGTVVKTLNTSGASANTFSQVSFTFSTTTVGTTDVLLRIVLAKVGSPGTIYLPWPALEISI